MNWAKAWKQGAKAMKASRRRWRKIYATMDEELLVAHDALQNAKAELAEIRLLLKRIEYAGEFCDEPACPDCMVRYFKKHSRTCQLAKHLEGE